MNTYKRIIRISDAAAQQFAEIYCERFGATMRPARNDKADIFAIECPATAMHRKAIDMLVNEVNTSW